jgi:SAM-dependent methyltransferase
VQYTYANVIFPDGSQTLPANQPIAETGICQAALRDLALAFPLCAAATISVADLGCLEGGYAAEFARQGYDVTGIEARADNMECCREVQAALGLPNLKFEQGDVRELLPGRRYDAVFCSGLLYHLNFPVEFLRLLGQVTRRLLIVQTHFSVHPEAVHEGRNWHWFGEGTDRWSAAGNNHSFWLTRRDLLDSIRDAGFPLVFEQDDYREPGGDYHDAAGNLESPDRGMFVGIKP